MIGFAISTASQRLASFTINFSASIRLSSLHFGQNRGKFVNTVSFLASVLFVGAGITEHDQHCPCTTATVQYVLTGFFQKLLQQVGVILAAQVVHCLLYTSDAAAASNSRRVRFLYFWFVIIAPLHIHLPFSQFILIEYYHISTQFSTSYLCLQSISNLTLSIFIKSLDFCLDN